MARRWGNKSRVVYDRLDTRLQTILDRVLVDVADISLVSGYRDRDEQEALFAAGASKLRWPDSKHNKFPSKAVDFQPYPYPSDECKLWGALGYVAGRAIEIAEQEGITLRWGGDWNQNGDLTDQKFDDLFHLEIVDDEKSTGPASDNSGSMRSSN